MKTKSITSIICLFTVLVFTGFSWPWSIEGKMAGNWKVGRLELTFREGVINYLHNSSVFAAYKILDGNSIRYTRKSDDYVEDRIVIVTFPSSQTMAWSLESGGTTNLWRTFERIND
jgi:hypothetical protein